ncbi:MAG: ABC transporter permease, partial [Actinomycetota bacterium]
AVAVALMRLSHVRGLRNVVVGYSAVAANMGGIPLAFAFLAAFGMQGLATRLLNGINIDLIGWGFRISDFWGIVLVYLYFQIPLMTLVIVPALDGLRKTWLEGAQSLGASTRQYWRFVALPILTPALLGGFLLLVANAFAAYATAFALSAGGSRLVPVQIRFFLQGETITGKTNLGYALAAWMVIITAFLVLGFQILSRRAERWRR